LQIPELFDRDLRFLHFCVFAIFNFCDLRFLILVARGPSGTAADSRSVVTKKFLSRMPTHCFRGTARPHMPTCDGFESMV
jgi:hypothetical protein